MRRWVGLAAVLLAGCPPQPPTCHGTRDAGMGADAGLDAATLTADGFVDAQRIARCAYAIRCESIADFGFGVDEPDVCTATGSLRDAEDIAAGVSGLAAGTRTFDPIAAARCLDAYATTPCDGSVLVDPLIACDDVFAGTSLEGARCAATEECVPGLVCTSARCGAGCALTCSRPFADGTTCVDSSGCLRHHACAGSPTAGVNVCQPRVATGDACRDDLPCLQWTDTPELCSGVCPSHDQRVGDLCFEACRGNVFCVAESGSVEGRCVAGAAIGCACHADATCRSTSTCPSFAPCAVGGRCVDATCREIVMPGATCDSDHVCPVGFACTAGICA